MIAGPKRCIVVSSLLVASLVHAETPVEVTLIDELDEPRAGYCLDTRGRLNQGEVLALQSHSCRSYQGQLDGDQTFDADKISEGTFELFELGLCMTARTPTVNSELTFEPCTGDAVQKFAYSTSGTITPVATPERCLTVVEGPVRSAGRVTPPHRARDITLQPCGAGRANRQLWQLRGPPE
jgi:hypothetical protein